MAINMSIQQVINNRMNIVQHWMEGNYHLRHPDEVRDMIAQVSKFWSVLSEEDKDYIEGARYAIDEQIEWILEKGDTQ